MKKGFHMVTWLVFGLLIVTPLVLISYSGNAASAAPKTTAAASKTATAIPQYGGTLRVATTTGPTFIGWKPKHGGWDYTCASPACEPLVDIDENFNFKPTGLSTKYSLSKDGKVLTLTLRRGVKFHDGTDFNAKAAKWNIDIMLGSGMLGTENWESVDVIDDYTVRINHKVAGFTMFANLHGASAWMMSPTAYAVHGEKWMYENVVGTGPFKMVSFTRDSSVKYTKFADYWQKGLPYLDGIDVYVIPKAQQAAMALKAGEIDLVQITDMNVAKDLQQSSFDVMVWPWGYYGLAPDSRNPGSPLAKKEVREALEYAINKKAIADVLGYGFWTPLYQYGQPAWAPAYVPDLPKRTYDPGKAKLLLAKAGYPEGFKTQIILQKGVIDENALVAIQSDWKAIGVDVEIQTYPIAQHEQMRRQGWNSGFLFKRTAVERLFSRQLEKFDDTYSDYKSTERPPKWADLVKAVQAAPDFKSYSTAAKKAVTAHYDYAMFINLWGFSQTIAKNPKVHDSGHYLPTTPASTQWYPARAWLSK